MWQNSTRQMTLTHKEVTMTKDGKAGNGLRYRQTWKRRQKSELQLTGNTTIMVRFCRTVLVKWQELIGKWQWITMVEMEIDYNMDTAVKVSFVLDYLLLQYAISKSRNRSIPPCFPSLAWKKQQTNRSKWKTPSFATCLFPPCVCLEVRWKRYGQKPHRKKSGTKSNSPLKYSIVKTGCWPSTQRILTSEHLLIAERNKWLSTHNRDNHLN